MTELANTPETERSSPDWLQYDDGTLAVLRKVGAAQSGISKLAREYRGLTASASEMRHNISGIRAEFEEASNDIGRIFDEVENLVVRTERLEAAITRSTELLEKLVNQPD